MSLAEVNDQIEYVVELVIPEIIYHNQILSLLSLGIVWTLFGNPEEIIEL